jgi:hypothetical protein
VNLLVDIVIDEPGGPFYRAIFTHEKEYLATRFDQSPTVDDIINFVNYCGGKLAEAQLHDPEKFFRLPVVEDHLANYMQPLYSADQPTAFRDTNGDYWIGVITEQGLRRKMVSSVRIWADAPIKVDVVE